MKLLLGKHVVFEKKKERLPSFLFRLFLGDSARSITMSLSYCLNKTTVITRIKYNITRCSILIHRTLSCQKPAQKLFPFIAESPLKWHILTYALSFYSSNVKKSQNNGNFLKKVVFLII